MITCFELVTIPIAKSITKPIIYYKWPFYSITNEKTKYELPNQLEYQLTISFVITSH